MIDSVIKIKIYISNVFFRLVIIISKIKLYFINKYYINSKKSNIVKLI